MSKSKKPVKKDKKIDKKWLQEFIDKIKTNGEKSFN